MRIDPATDMLGLIDVQPTFMPGGALAVAEGDAVVPVINRLLDAVFPHAFATQDWHPPGHVSFATTHARAPYETIDLPYGRQVLWPDHAIQDTAEAALHPELELRRVEVIVRKGFRPDLDSYSAFFENDRATPTGLHGFLQDRGVRRLFLAGLATDFCVAWSAEDAARLGLSVVVVEDACRGIALTVPEGGTSLDVARKRLASLGVQFVAAAALTPGA